VHGKELICRAFFIERTTKKKRTTNKLFVVRSKKTHGKDLFAVRFLHDARQSTFSPLPHFKQMKCRFLKKLCRAFFRGARQTHEFAVRFLSYARQNIFFIFPKSQIQLLLKKFSSPLNLFDSLHTTCYTSC
jgi:hypothetical protein